MPADKAKLARDLRVKMLFVSAVMRLLFMVVPYFYKLGVNIDLLAQVSCLFVNTV